MHSIFSKLLYCFVVPLKTQATINPANVLDDEYADITSDPAQQMIDSIIPEVRIIFHTLLYHETSASARKLCEAVSFCKSLLGSGL